MSQLTTKLLRLLSAGTLEQRTAAAIVVGELAPKHASVVKHLTEAAEGSERALRLKAIEALGKIGSTAARDALYPLLDKPEETREAAARALAAIGNAVVPTIKQTFPTASLAKRRTLLRVLALVRTDDAISFLVHVLEEPTSGVSRDVVRIVKDETTTLDDDARAELSKQFRAPLRRKTFVENRVAVDSILDVLTHLRDPASARTFLDFSGPEHPADLRRTALTGLRWTLPGYRHRAAAVTKLLSFLEEDDFPNVVSPALEALVAMTMPKSAGKQLIQLAESRHPLVRKFALTKMSEVGDDAVTGALVDALGDSDPMIRQLAARSIQAQSGAWKVIVAELGKGRDVEHAWRMVRAVKAGASKVDPDAMTGVAKTAIGKLESGDENAEPMLHLVQTLTPEVHFETLHKRALYWKRKGSFDVAERLLAQLTTNEHQTDAARFDLAVVSLRSAKAPAGSITRDNDTPLAIVRSLVREKEFPVYKKLMAEGDVLELNDLYYLGFHLIEGNEAERDMGEQLLRHIVERSPRSKIGRAAKSKLRIEGLT